MISARWCCSLSRTRIVLLLARLLKFVEIQFHLAQDAIQCSNWNIACAVHRHRCRTTVRMSKNAVRAASSHDLEPHTFKRREERLPGHLGPQKTGPPDRPFVSCCRKSHRDARGEFLARISSRYFLAGGGALFEAEFNDLASVAKRILDVLAPRVCLGKSRHDDIDGRPVRFGHEYHGISDLHHSFFVSSTFFPAEGEHRAFTSISL